MADLVVITPSRGRPAQLAAMTEAVRATAGGWVKVIGLVDADDPHLAAYQRLDCQVVIGPRRSLSGWTNWAARMLLDGHSPPRYFASLGDDHRPRGAWDLKLIAAIEQLDGPGFAYGNDLYQGVNMPTAWVASAAAVRALGWMMLPTCEHLYVDAAVLQLGKAANRIAYVPEVVIEHLHPYAGKADMDESYRQSNSRERFAADEAAYRKWLNAGLDRDVKTLRALTY